MIRINWRHAVVFVLFSVFPCLDAQSLDDAGFLAFWSGFAAELQTKGKEALIEKMSFPLAYKKYVYGYLEENKKINQADFDTVPERMPVPVLFLPDNLPDNMSSFDFDLHLSMIIDSTKFAIGHTNDGKYCFYIRKRNLLALRFYKIYVFDYVESEIKIVKIIDEIR